ncbi:MAG: hypothetical protein PHT55_08755, partial [Spirochaetales bacterium]|nr:hypothetical protein [Spirochaetales bacterium]
MYTKRLRGIVAFLATCGVVLAAFALVLGGCSSQKGSLSAGLTISGGGIAPANTLDPSGSPDAASAASAAADWSVELKGLRSDSLSQSYYQKLKSAGQHYLRKTVDKKGVSVEYSGLSLAAVIAIVDGDDSTHPFQFNADRWAEGYDVVLTAADGYSVSFSTKDVAPQALILADTEAGAYLSTPMTVGDTAKNLWVKDLVSITTSLAPNATSAEAEAFSLELDINGMKASMSLAEL